jgi:secondary thiamine-phosphate synthase enzyme
VITLEVKTTSTEEILDLSREVGHALRESGLVEGLCHLFVPHTTAGIAVNENADPDVKRDILMALGKLVPDDPAFRHAEGNSAAHLKSLLSGASVSLPVSGGQLELGTWGGIYFCEFDGPRQRKLHISFAGTRTDGHPLFV